jgi:hypothetical protein
LGGQNEENDVNVKFLNREGIEQSVQIVKCEEKMQFEIPSNRWEENIKI